MESVSATFYISHQDHVRQYLNMVSDTILSTAKLTLDQLPNAQISIGKELIIRPCGISLYDNLESLIEDTIRDNDGHFSVNEMKIICGYCALIELIYGMSPTHSMYDAESFDIIGLVANKLWTYLFISKRDYDEYQAYLNQTSDYFRVVADLHGQTRTVPGNDAPLMTLYGLESIFNFDSDDMIEILRTFPQCHEIHLVGEKQIRFQFKRHFFEFDAQAKLVIPDQFVSILRNGAIENGIDGSCQHEEFTFRYFAIPHINKETDDGVNILFLRVLHPAPDLMSVIAHQQ